MKAISEGYHPSNLMAVQRPDAETDYETINTTGLGVSTTETASTGKTKV